MGDAARDLAEWFEAYSRPLGLYARQWLHGDAAADIVQDAFLKLLSQRRRPDDVRAWLFTAVRNATMNELRRRRTRSRHAGDILACRPQWFEPQLGDALDAQAVQEALAKLPPEQGELIIMRIWGQMTYEQMAQVAGEPLSSIYVRYSAAIQMLREKMVTTCKTKTQ